MRAAFLAAVLLFAGGYTWFAFAGLSWLSSAGRLGPAFFPRVIGVALVAVTTLCLVEELRRRTREPASEFWRLTLQIAVLSALLVAALETLGGLLAMVAYLGASLWLLNRGRPLQNALVAVLMPVFLYVLFKVWLNAALPRGPLPF
ncbi:MAG TPA: tripartite tricarboxylate transporter TctB family protein [Burkholderiales bacterium]|nr:tripartite tricarboxylate transporter TctB family protein [Burkholderiales bacterium]